MPKPPSSVEAELVNAVISDKLSDTARCFVDEVSSTAWQLMIDRNPQKRDEYENIWRDLRETIRKILINHCLTVTTNVTKREKHRHAPPSRRKLRERKASTN